jgi:hypothetical protein
MEAYQGMRTQRQQRSMKLLRELDSWRSRALAESSEQPHAGARVTEINPVFQIGLQPIWRMRRRLGPPVWTAFPRGGDPNWDARWSCGCRATTVSADRAFVYLCGRHVPSPDANLRN